MFVKISALAVLLPLVSALTLTTPTNWDSASPANISWTITSSTDPYTWSFELVNPDNFHNSFGLANNVDSSLGQITVTLPVVPTGGGYYLEAVNITNINDVFAQSGMFSIGATPSSSSSATASSSSSTGSSSASTTGSSSSTGSASSASTPAATSSTPNATPSSFGNNANGAATPGASLGSWAMMAAGAVAGAFAAL